MGLEWVWDPSGTELDGAEERYGGAGVGGCDWEMVDRPELAGRNSANLQCQALEQTRVDFISTSFPHIFSQVPNSQARGRTLLAQRHQLVFDLRVCCQSLTV